MTDPDRLSRILAAAGAEAAARKPAEVVNFPLVSAHLKRRPAPLPEPEPIDPVVPDGVRVWPEWIGWGVRTSKYLGFGVVIISLLLVGGWVRRTLINAEAGAVFCAAEPLAIPEYTCEASALTCMTATQETLVRDYERQARHHNKRRAEICMGKG